MSSTAKARLEVRQAKISDIPAIAQLIRRVYKDMPPYTHGELRGQMNNFREGQFVAVLDDELVGYCASSRISGSIALQPHDWEGAPGHLVLHEERPGIEPGG